MPQSKFVVNNKAPMGLHIRKQPEPTDSTNILGVLTVNQEVEKLEETPLSDWWKVSASLNGIPIEGYVNKNYLAEVGENVVVVEHEGVVEVHLPTSGLTVVRGSKARLAHPLTEIPPVKRQANDPPQKRLDAVRQLISWLRVESSLRYRSDGMTYCNIYAYDYCYLTGAYLPRVWWTGKALIRLDAGETVPVKYPGSEPGTVNEKVANELNEWFKDWGPHFGWRQSLDLTEMQDEANQGRVCITVARSKPQYHHGHGHIVAVVPENDDQRAIRQNGKVIATVQSQAGAHNYSYHVNHWWNDGTYSDFGHWIHQ
ncbi:MAG TPA: SH3 domain-containing protein [Pyrinomonadaceae bacterium]|nr:SH3 domain-containing protein [Pyrinomonadaceae bacterium]